VKHHRSIPNALQIVAVLFLLGGVCSVIGIVVRLVSGSIHFDLGVFGIPTYFGLRRLSFGCRTFALVCIWIALIVCPIAFIFGICGSAPTSAALFGIRFAQVAPIWLSVVSVPIFLLELWQYRVLTHPQVRALFLVTPNATNVA
jgi:hypothetical protein